MKDILGFVFYLVISNLSPVGCLLKRFFSPPLSVPMSIFLSSLLDDEELLDDGSVGVGIV